MRTRSEKLRKQFEAAFGATDAEEKLDNLQKKLADNTELSEYAVFLQKFPKFFDTIEASYLHYESKLKYTGHNLELGNDELSQANRELETLNLTINAMLDGFGQGLLFFNHEGICSPVYSKACLTLLENDPAGKHIVDLLKVPDSDRKSIIDWIKMLFGGKIALTFEELAEIAPSSYLHSEGLHIKLDYKPLFDSDGKLKNVLVIATDATKEQQAQARMAENESRALRTLRIARNRNYFLRFISQFRSIFMESDLLDDECTGFDLEQFKRDVHTMKGLSGTFHLDKLTKILNDIETDMNKVSTHKEAQELLLSYYYKLNENFNSSLQLAKEVLGSDFEGAGNTVNIQTRKILGFAQDIKLKLEKGITPDEISLMLLQELIAVPIREIFANFDMQLQELADRAGKMVNPCLFLGENFVILPEKYENFTTSLVHVARNIIDHAIDEPDIRKQFGKLPKGYITVHNEKVGDKFNITITDDGNGIDVDSIRNKISGKIDANILAAMSDEEIIQHIFDDNISSRDEVSELSGRGVGMSAVKAEVEALGGSIMVKSTIGKGTSLHITLPLIWN